MAKGSCICGEIQYEVGEPAMTTLCHCVSCQKSSGTPTSHNFIYKDDQFKLTKGIPKTYQRLGDSGKSLTYHSCPTCPTVIYVKADAMPGMCIVKMGTLDDTSAKSNPKWNAEIYNKDRLPQCQPVDGAKQADSKVTV